MTDPEAKAGYKFEIGQIMHHRRYNYRGAIYARDETCMADEAWYQKNQTQPNRSQPWYHVMVDGSTHTTYVAESNIELDESTEPVLHPLLDRFFKSFLNGRYYTESIN